MMFAQRVDLAKSKKTEPDLARVPLFLFLHTED
jgi:hypothetical protein